jgi:hypothetical protein
MNRDAARRLAGELGLTRLDGATLDQLASSAEDNRAASAKLPKDLHWSEEIALAFALPATVAAPGWPNEGEAGETKGGIS